MCKAKPTEKQYISLQEAFSLFNRAMFGDTLPPVLITFQRHKKAFGFFHADKMASRQDGTTISEIALNIQSFMERNDKQIFSTLAHEMVHHWQHVYGKMSRGGYHNKEWGDKMEAVGLMPSNTGEPGGKKTGQQMTHYVIEGGLFDTVYNELVEAGVSIDWNSNPDAKKPSKAANKTKYTCPVCDANAWGKPELNITCNDCDERMTVV